MKKKGCLVSDFEKRIYVIYAKQYNNLWFSTNKPLYWIFIEYLKIKNVQISTQDQKDHLVVLGSISFPGIARRKENFQWNKDNKPRNPKKCNKSGNKATGNSSNSQGIIYNHRDRVIQQIRLIWKCVFMCDNDTHSVFLRKQIRFSKHTLVVKIILI